jgi:hypothetical protein
MPPLKGSLFGPATPSLCPKYTIHPFSCHSRKSNPFYPASSVFAKTLRYVPASPFFHSSSSPTFSVARSSSIYPRSLSLATFPDQSLRFRRSKHRTRTRCIVRHRLGKRTSAPCARCLYRMFNSRKGRMATGGQSPSVHRSGVR